MTDGTGESSKQLLSLRDAVQLGHALVQHVADQADVRILFIKGPVADARGVRPPRISADVDVLVPESGLSSLLLRLGQRGWVRRPESFAHSAFVRHSVTLLHPLWPCDIDVHVSYPGFLADPEIVFETLWAHREPLQLAGRSVDAPDFAGSVVLAALHSLRAPYLERNRTELDDALAAVRARDDIARVVDEIATIASQAGALHTAEPLLAALGHTVGGPPPRTPEYFAWRRGARQLNRSAQWLRAILDSPLRESPGLLRRALLPSRRDLLADHPGTPDTAAGLLAARLSRLASGARAMPSALGTLWEERSIGRAPRRRQSFATASAIADDRVATSPSLLQERPTAATRSATDATTPVVRRARHVGVVDHGSTVVLLDLAGHGSRPVVLTGSGIEIWSTLKKPSSLEAVTADVADAHGVDAHVVAGDVSNFIAQLVEFGVARFESPSPTSREPSGTEGVDHLR